MMNEDQRRWAGGICVKDGKILLVHRINKERELHQEYFIFPGGAVRGGSNIEATLTQEFSNCGLHMKLGERLYALEKDESEESEYYYLCNYVAGELTPKPIDELNDGIKQFYTPMWVPLSELDELMLCPEEIKELILELLEDK